MIESHSLHITIASLKTYCPNNLEGFFDAVCVCICHPLMLFSVTSF